MTVKNQAIEYLIIDWGTTNFRAFALDNQGQVQDKKELGLGLLQVEDADFANALQGVLANWLNNYQSLPIFMAGMVGSAQGWVNVDYAATPVNNRGLINNAYRFELPWGALATIIPGVSHQAKNGVYDVMRGEEVQLFGLAKLTQSASLTAVMPGTHSKHAVLDNGKMTEFASFMTGELFSVISQHTILGRGLPKQIDNQDAFLRGVTESKTEKLTSALFAARTHRLFNNIQESDVYDYLSGLLIGYELNNLANNLTNNPVYLVGGKGLCARYQTACDALSISAIYMNGDECFLAGMADLISELSNV
ncbi:hypothetical protein C2869_00705 [Saccharobesus litoralis]|uniref:2-dehydro-3-deoxygalactonokinase n=1 Tax=Saccharobesus litoralis TaxID=2172099 RepID=A0A2S0VLG5_9ALTE|nr:2-dehydro-3-deoxygalactonokinase [Saccharobesus litoralis]AWB65048.1 hypothetical protein C2869_00705 [Saccharobesus litoralis]